MRKFAQRAHGGIYLGARQIHVRHQPRPGRNSRDDTVLSEMSLEPVELRRRNVDIHDIGLRHRDREAGGSKLARQVFGVSVILIEPLYVMFQGV